ncbi:MAG: di-heme oxidoredictase family protein, partial [Alphaproteobacteria bacterium]|nr:di-heme oxidoredictase family protein [Alphaproteobacteria bacterium]
GTQIQDRALPNIPIEGVPQVVFKEVSGQYMDGTIYKLRMPKYNVKDLQFGSLGWEIQFSGRVAQPLFGVGFLEAIPIEAIKALEDPEDRNTDGISGRLARVVDRHMKVKVGRFGWKASQPDLFAQTALALHQDMGLTSAEHMEQNCTRRQLACNVAAKQTGPEVNAAQLDQLVAYQRALAPLKTGPSNDLGRILFVETGCAACHRPSWELPDTVWPPMLSNITIYPYTDMLLHDMGPGLADGLAEGAASASEWRTAPLWGISARMPYRLLHDGRARSIEEAILWHDGEGRIARENFRALEKHERDALAAFVAGL